MGITNAAPFGAGVLTGDARFAGSYGYKPITQEVARSVAEMTGLCRDAGVPLSAAALQFSMSDPRMHSTIVGVSTRKGSIGPQPMRRSRSPRDSGRRSTMSPRSRWAVDDA